MSEMLKVCLVGDTGVGKTSIVNHFLGDPTAYKSAKPTVAVEANPSIDMEASDGRLVSLSIWDTAGQEKYRSLIPMFFGNASACIIVSSYDNRATFESVGEWQDTVFQRSPNCKIIFAANKCDLTPAEGITDEYISNVGRSINALEIFKTSAVTGEGIKNLFQFIVDSSDIEKDQLYLEGLTDEDKGHLNLTINEKDNGTGRGCC